MADLRTQLEQYLVETTDPIDVHQVVAQSQNRDTTVALPPRRWGIATAVAVAVAVLIVVGVPLGLLGVLLGDSPSDESITDPPASGGRETMELADDSVPAVASTVPPSSSAAPDATIAPVAPPTTVPSAPLPSTVPDSSPTTIPPAVLASGFTWQTYLMIDPDGGFAAAFFSEVDGAIKLLRCPDSSCTEPTTIILPGTSSLFDEGNDEELAPLIEDLALRPDGSPIVIVSAGGSSTIHACADPKCGSIEISVFAENEEVAMGTPRLAIAEDGLPRVAYADFEARSLKLAVCQDPLCESHSAVTIHDDILIPGEASIHIEDDGRLFIGYEIMREGQPFAAAIAVCTDDTCSTEPAVSTFENAVKSRWTMINDEAFLAWYRSGPEIVAEGDRDVSAMLDAWDLMVAECDIAGCGEARQIEVGLELLEAWGGFSTDLRLLQMPGGRVVAAYGYWSPDHCAQLLTVVTLESQLGTTGTELGTYVGGPFAVSAISDTELLLVYQGSEGEVHVVEIPTTAPGPAKADQTLTDACLTP